MSDAIADREALTGAYLRERAGLARRGLTDRVALVDAELARLGHPVEAPPAAPPMRATEAPRARRTRKTKKVTQYILTGAEVLAKGLNPQPVSGRQERLENLWNRYV